MAAAATGGVGHIAPQIVLEITDIDIARAGAAVNEPIAAIGTQIRIRRIADAAAIAGRCQHAERE